MNKYNQRVDGICRDVVSWPVVGPGCLEWYVQDPIQRKGLGQQFSVSQQQIPREPTGIQILSDPQEPGQIYLMGSRNVQVPNSTQVMLRSVRLIWYLCDEVAKLCEATDYVPGTNPGISSHF